MLRSVWMALPSVSRPLCGSWIGCTSNAFCQRHLEFRYGKRPQVTLLRGNSERRVRSSVALVAALALNDLKEKFPSLTGTVELIEATLAVFIIHDVQPP